MDGWFNDINNEKGSDNVFAFNPSVPGLPAPVKAAPGPNGEEYYYYYYYYDDEEGEKNVSALDIKLHLHQKQMWPEISPINMCFPTQGLDSAPGS